MSQNIECGMCGRWFDTAIAFESHKCKNQKTFKQTNLTNPEWVLGVKQGFDTFRQDGLDATCETLVQWEHMTGFSPEKDNLPEHMMGFAYVIGMWHEGLLN